MPLKAPSTASTHVRNRAATLEVISNVDGAGETNHGVYRRRFDTELLTERRKRYEAEWHILGDLAVSQVERRIYTLVTGICLYRLVQCKSLGRVCVVEPSHR